LSNYLRSRWAKLVQGGSWRPYSSDDFWNDYDAVISVTQQGQGRRGNSYEVYTFGQLIATRTNLYEAKAAVEDVYGPLLWQRVKLPPVTVDHAYGPTEEFSEPTVIYVVERLPKL
jgi:hypothetical protein